MSTWYSSLASRVKDAVFASEADGETEDDTHVCRVLRNYYTEKGQAFPGWLPPDPKAPPPPPVVQQAPPNRYGAAAQTAQNPGGLSSLWDKRRAEGGSAPPAPVSNRNPFARNNAVSPGLPSDQAVQARPLPSQRGGSYQTTGSADSGGGNSIQDRLKSRLGGGTRTVSPGNSTGPFAPPPPQGSGGSASPYGRRGAAAAGSGDYDPYKSGSYDNGSSGGGGGGYGDAQPAAAPSGGGRFGGGLPSGPRRMGGLPSGPRMR